jgi:hypothetical protein
VRKLKLILDADVSIYLKGQGLWDKVINAQDIYLAETVAEKELQDYRNSRSFGERRTFDLSDDIKNNKIKIAIVDAIDLAAMVSILDKAKCPRLDAGELESLTAVYFEKPPELLFCVCENAAIKCAVFLDVTNKIVSLESVLKSSKIHHKCSKQFSEERFARRIEISRADKIQSIDFSTL